MYINQKLTLLAAFTLVLFIGSRAQADVRDAGSKIRGDAAIFDAPTVATRYMYSRQARVQAPTQQRAYSLETRNQAAPATARLAQQPSTAVRHYSVEAVSPTYAQPAYSRPTNSPVQARGPAYLRADSKILGYSGH
jgi:hypothetical protein